MLLKCNEVGSPFAETTHTPHAQSRDLRHAHAGGSILGSLQVPKAQELCAKLFSFVREDQDIVTE